MLFCVKEHVLVMCVETILMSLLYYTRIFSKNHTAVMFKHGVTCISMCSISLIS